MKKIKKFEIANFVISGVAVVACWAFGFAELEDASSWAFVVGGIAAWLALGAVILEGFQKDGF